MVFFTFNIFSVQISRSGPLDDITYPIIELGNCESKQECKIYCDQKENIDACISFAEKKKLLKKEEIEKAKKFTKLRNKKGPGGCLGKEECEIYCDNMNHIGECLVFARQNNLMSPEELREAEQVVRALERGVEMPGRCKTKESCEEYCDNHDHFNECVKFAEAAGFVSEKEANMLKKTGGKGPGGCIGKRGCDLFCDNPNNMEVCMEYAIKYDLMPLEEMEEAKMALQAIKKGAKMPNCKDRKECDIYCSQLEHMEECMEFALAAGFMSEEDVRQARKMMEAGFTAGPGGCKEKEECEVFCNNPDNIETCIEFAYKIGEIPEEDYRRMMENKEKMLMGGPGGCGSGEECRAYCDNPNNWKECTEFAYKMGDISEEEYKMMSESGHMRPMFGPGECQSLEECERYCQDPNHFEECSKFNREDDGRDYKDEGPGDDINWMESRGPGPGGCMAPEECKHYCSDPNNIEECRRFSSSGPNEYQDEGFEPGFDPRFKECNSPEECEVYYRDQENMHKEEYDNYHDYRGDDPRSLDYLEEFNKFGPGGCQSPEECRRYCSDPNHFEECKNFGSQQPPVGEIKSPVDVLNEAVEPINGYIEGITNKIIGDRDQRPAEKYYPPPTDHQEGYMPTPEDGKEYY